MNATDYLVVSRVKRLELLILPGGVEVPFRGFLLRPHKTEPEGCIMIFPFELSTNQIFFSSAILCMVSICTLVFS